MVGREQSEARPEGAPRKRTANGVSRERVEGGSAERGEPSSTHRATFPLSNVRHPAGWRETIKGLTNMADTLVNGIEKVLCLAHATIDTETSGKAVFW
jgi:hypothetical protein